MIVTEKKQYITPQAKSVEFNPNTLLAGSDRNGSIGEGGDNTQPGAPTTAEGKSIWNYGDWDEE